MTEAARSTDISDFPELVAIAEEVEESGEPRILRLRGREVARVVPPRKPPRARRKPSEADVQASMGSAGGWANEDTDAFLEYVYARRALPPKPPVDL